MVADGERAGALRERAVFVRAAGTTSTGASGRSVGDPRGPRPRPRAPDQADAAVAAPRRGCRCALRAGSPRRAARPDPPRRPAAAAPGDEAERRSRRRSSRARARAGSGSRSGSGSPRPGAKSANARSARCVASRGSSAAPSPLDLDQRLARRPSTCSSFQRSSAAPAQSKPGPRFAVVAGRDEASDHPDRLEHRVERRLDDIRVTRRRRPRAASFSPWPVRTQTTVAPLELEQVLERGEPGGRRRLAEDALLAVRARSQHRVDRPRRRP